MKKVRQTKRQSDITPGTNQDTRYLAQTEDTLENSRELYRTLIETSPDGIILSDIDIEKGNIVMANQEAAVLLGYKSVKDIFSHLKSTIEIFIPKDRDKALKNAGIILKKGYSKNNEYSIQTGDGASVPVEISTSLIKDSQGKPRYFLSTIRDIRERKAAQEKLIQVDKMVSLGTLVSGITHELNNPASSILMNAETFSMVWQEILPVLDRYYQTSKDFSIASHPYQDAKIKISELISGLLNSTRRINNFIRELRDFSRPEDLFFRQEVDINRVIHASVDLTDNIIKKSTKHFVLDLGENLPLYSGSFQKLEQVFINLIQNACQALRSNNQGIYISTAYIKKDNQIVVKVTDEGKGIEEKDMKYITNPFFTTKRSAGGSGLGLFISLKIVQAHGGFMTFQSKSGKGTTVSVQLPMNNVTHRENPG